MLTMKVTNTNILNLNDFLLALETIKQIFSHFIHETNNSLHIAKKLNRKEV